MSTRTGLETVQNRVEEIPVPGKRVRQALSIVLFFIGWWALVAFEVSGFGNFVSPVVTLEAFAGYLAGEPMTDGETSIYVHSAYSTARVIAAVLVAVAVAIPLGLTIGTSRRWEDALFPALETFRPVPPVAWVPLALLILPTFRSGVLFVVFIGAFFPILINTIEGVKTVEEEYVRAASSLGADARGIFRHVIFPATLPSIITGVAIGVGLAWITVVAAEMVAGGTGIGYIIFQAYRLLDTPTIAVGMITVGILGYASSAVVYRVGQYLTPWGDVESA